MKEESIIIDPKDIKTAKGYLDQDTSMPAWVTSALPEDQDPKAAEALYRELKTAAGLDYYDVVNRLIEEGDAKALERYAKEKLDGNPTLKAAVMRLLPFVG